MKINKNYYDLTESYLFSTIGKKVAEFQEKHPEKKVIKLVKQLLIRLNYSS